MMLAEILVERFANTLRELRTKRRRELASIAALERQLVRERHETAMTANELGLLANFLDEHAPGALPGLERSIAHDDPERDDPKRASCWRVYAGVDTEVCA